MATFVDTAGSAMFVFLHEPLGPCLGGAVICPPTYAEFAKNYRREFLLGRALASRGITAVRFHPRGMGQSGGTDGDITLETLVDDARAAARWITERSAMAARVVYLGTRIGALVAAAASEGAPLVLWQPVIEASRYFDEMERLELMSKAARAADAPTYSPLTHRLWSEGTIDVLGYSIHRPLYESLMGSDLDGLVSTKSVLLAQIGGRRLDHAYEQLVMRWRQQGRNITVQVAPEDESWWFADGIWQSAENRPATVDLVEVTARWCSDRIKERKP